MKKKKAPKKPEDAGNLIKDGLEPMAIYRIARILRRDRPTLAKIMDQVKPIKETDKAKFYYLSDVVDMLVSGTTKKEAKDSEARYKTARAALAETKLAAMKRELVPAVDVERAVTGLLIGVKRRLLAIPTRIAPRIAKAKTSAAAMQLLRLEVNQSLTDLSEIDPIELLGTFTEEDEAEDDAAPEPEGDKK